MRPCSVCWPPLHRSRWEQGQPWTAAAALGLPGASASVRRATYAASKAAIVGFTKSLALDLAPLGITVNAVCPGPIRTTRAISTNRREYGDDLEVGFRERAKDIPVGRFGEPEEIAKLALYLCSEDAGFITGTDVVIDGGWTAQ